MLWRKSSQIKFLSLGITCSVFYNFIFSQIPVVQKLELQLQDTLLRLNQPKTPPPEIILVKIQPQDLANQKLSLGRLFYADLVENLLKAGASVVVLNLHNDWEESPDFEYSVKMTESINKPLKNLVQNHNKQIVLVTRTNSITNSKKPKFFIYNHLIPFDSERLKPLIPPETIQGFFEYEPEAEAPTHLGSTARSSHLVSPFFLSEKIDEIQTFKSVTLLALEKWEQQEQKVHLSSRLAKITNPVKIKFWGKSGTFPFLELTSICRLNKDKKCLVASPHKLSQQVRNKVVFIGFVEANNVQTMAMLSPFGDSMAGVEIQANIMASLMTDSFLQIPSQWVELIIVILGGFLISIGIYNYQNWHLLFIVLAIFSGYLGLCLIVWKCKWILLIQPLQEPQFNSIWIEHREEIYRFFREALNNVIQHAQPPHGTATQVFVSLEQQGDKCTLVIANDGAILASTYRPKKGGYGTKIMDTIANELLDGVWEISVLPNGEVRVTLSWHLPN
ncbi:CHASE2 domain-containing protein [Dolichospermum lemmermannii]|uniref:CHASE2 domain-containing protein n=1 Tax=Dolichospermum lemmermannii TaxID=54295 RepID=UPI00232EA56B|nr:CHASE2 domain-containing protein [Dolichospermum lemmermannii]